VIPSFERQQTLDPRTGHIVVERPRMRAQRSIFASQVRELLQFPMLGPRLFLPGRNALVTSRFAERRARCLAQLLADTVDWVTGGHFYYGVGACGPDLVRRAFTCRSPEVRARLPICDLRSGRARLSACPQGRLHAGIAAIIHRRTTPG
jgi:hypothetical protein